MKHISYHESPMTTTYMQPCSHYKIQSKVCCQLQWLKIR